MATSLNIICNLVDSTKTYQVNPSHYIILDLDYDYIIWTAGSATVKDKMTAEPTEEELIDASSIIDDLSDVTVTYAMVMDYSHSYQAGIYTHVIDGMGETNKRYVFGFSFDDDTASEPQLEAWDDDTHTTTDNNCLGGLSGYDSFVHATVTTFNVPAWSGTALSGSGSVLLLNAGTGALDDVPSGQTTQELYANVRVIIPAAFPTPAFETFVLTVRYSYL